MKVKSLFMAAAVFLAACGGGSGGNINGGGVSGGDLTPSPVATPADYETPEYFGLYYNYPTERWVGGDIGASAAYARGYSGQGVRIYSPESYIINHPDLLPQTEYYFPVDDGRGGLTYQLSDRADYEQALKDESKGWIPSFWIPRYEMAPSDDLSAPAHHGTHVIGVAAAARNGNAMHGVAFDAKIVVPFTNTDYLPSQLLDLEKQDRLDIATFSVGGFLGIISEIIADQKATAHEDLNQLLDEGIIMTFSAGNTAVGSFDESKRYTIPDGWKKYTTADEKQLISVIGVESVDDSASRADLVYRIARDSILVQSEIGGSSGCYSVKDICIAGFFNVITTDSLFPRQTTIPQLRYHAYTLGTSFSAPMVAGALAVIISAYPDMPRPKAANRMLKTATPICGTYNEPINGEACKDPNPGYKYEDADGVMQTYDAEDGTLAADCKNWYDCPVHGWPNDVYGWGLVNLDEATRVHGAPDELALAAADGNKAGYALPDSQIVSSPAFGNALLARDDLTFAFFDRDNALFPGLPFAAVRADNGEALRQSLGLLADGVIADSDAIIPAPPGRHLSWQAAPGDARLHYRDLTFRYQTDACDAAAAETIASSFNLAGAQSSSAGCRPRREVRSFAAMLNDFAPTAAAGELALTPRREYALSAKWQTVINPNNNIALFYERQTNSHLRAAAQWQIQAGDNLRLALEGGHLQEDDTLLGAEFNGALGVKDGASTAYARAAFHIQDGEWDAYASYVKARTNAEPKAGGIIADLSRVHSAGFAVGASKRGIFGGRDKLRAMVRRPLSVERGGMRLRYIGGHVADVEVRGQEALRIDEHKINLAGDALTIYGITYEREIGRIKAALALEHLRNSPGEKYAGDETALSAALRWEF